MKSIWAGVATVGVLSFVSSWAEAAPRTHDGFQFRGTIGPAYLSDSESFDGLDGSVKIHGGAAALELYFGGSPADGVTIGGFVSVLSAPGPSVEYKGLTYTADSDASLNLSTVGPYVDFYPDPNGGFHLLGTVGYARLSANNGDDDERSASGIGVGLGVGYDAWVSDEWSLGVLGRFTYAHAGHDESSLHFTENAIAPALLFSVNYH